MTYNNNYYIRPDLVPEIFGSHGRQESRLILRKYISPCRSHWIKCFSFGLLFLFPLCFTIRKLTLTVDDDILRCGKQVATTVFWLVLLSPCLPTSTLPVVLLRFQVSVLSLSRSVVFSPALFDFFACMFVDFLICTGLLFFVISKKEKRREKWRLKWTGIILRFDATVRICLIWSFGLYEC